MLNFCCLKWPPSCASVSTHPNQNRTKLIQTKLQHEFKCLNGVNNFFWLLGGNGNAAIVDTRAPQLTKSTTANFLRDSPWLFIFALEDPLLEEDWKFALFWTCTFLTVWSYELLLCSPQESTQYLVSSCSTQNIYLNSCYTLLFLFHCFPMFSLVGRRKQ